MSAVRPNLYDGLCDHCGEIVKARTGALERHPRLQPYTVLHKHCHKIVFELGLASLGDAKGKNRTMTS